jgi:hypothetical protein
MRLKRELSVRAGNALDPDRFFCCSSDDESDAKVSAVSSRRDVSRSATPSQRPSRATSRARSPPVGYEPGSPTTSEPGTSSPYAGYAQSPPDSDEEEEDSPSVLNRASDNASISSSFGHHIANHIDDYLTQPRCALPPLMSSRVGTGRANQNPRRGVAARAVISFVSRARAKVHRASKRWCCEAPARQLPSR